ncbi:MAG: hypothetical protein JSW58_02795 [Candidatus Latescibacterota bacterium]|nr:MAG: hypothetical protein JSW58_02795 [Candidatus Latescibacterota bacterium]
MRKRVFVTICIAVVAVVAAVGRGADDSLRTVQFVYHSDTRGYYLPCG